jgi:hypothetical protein
MQLNSTFRYQLYIIYCIKKKLGTSKSGCLLLQPGPLIEKTLQRAHIVLFKSIVKVQNCQLQGSSWAGIDDVPPHQLLLP